MSPSKASSSQSVEKNPDSFLHSDLSKQRLNNEVILYKSLLLEKFLI